MPVNHDPRWQEFAERLCALKKGSFAHHKPSKVRRLLYEKADYLIKKADEMLQKGDPDFKQCVSDAEKLIQAAAAVPSGKRVKGRAA